MKAKPPTHELINERRDYFRVEDTVQLRYCVVDAARASANTVPPAFENDPGYAVVRELQRIDREHSPQLRAIADRDRDLELYLKAINRKIELLASRLAAEGDTTGQKQQQQVTLSEGGLAFSADEALSPGTYLAVQLTLQPHYLSLVVFGEVVSCSAGTEGFSVAISFIHLRDEDRQAIARHIMQVQLAQRRQHHED